MNWNGVPHIAWLFIALVVQLAFYAVFAIVEHVEPVFLRLSIGATIAGILTLSRADVPPGSGKGG